VSTPVSKSASSSSPPPAARRRLAALEPATRALEHLAGAGARIVEQGEGAPRRGQISEAAVGPLRPDDDLCGRLTRAASQQHRGPGSQQLVVTRAKEGRGALRGLVHIHRVDPSRHASSSSPFR
jgi:hypothetical protein